MAEDPKSSIESKEEKEFRDFAIQLQDSDYGLQYNKIAIEPMRVQQQLFLAFRDKK